MTRIHLLLLGALLLPASAGANGDYETIHQYSVEFACGENLGGNPGVVPGLYATVVNVHNAGPDAVQARARVSLTVPGSDTSDKLMVEFAPQQSRQLDCGDIVSRFVFATPYTAEDLLEGYLLIQSTSELVVNARYTATGETGEVSVDVERVAGTLTRREIEGGERSVEICHVPPGNPGNAHEITVGESAVPAHLDHGDYEGACLEDEAEVEEEEEEENVGSSGSGYLPWWMNR
jgi:hypothetical protein